MSKRKPSVAVECVGIEARRRDPIAALPLATSGNVNELTLTLKLTIRSHDGLPMTIGTRDGLWLFDRAARNAVAKVLAAWATRGNLRARPAEEEERT